jgi:hypothetical protein
MLAFAACLSANKYNDEGNRDNSNDPTSGQGSLVALDHTLQGVQSLHQFRIAQVMVFPSSRKLVNGLDEYVDANAIMRNTSVAQGLGELKSHIGAMCQKQTDQLLRVARIRATAGNIVRVIQAIPGSAQHEQTGHDFAFKRADQCGMAGTFAPWPAVI